MNEWPLLIFTLLMQASIGLSVMLGICAKRLATTLGGNIPSSFLLRYLFIACVLAGVGLLSSITHLGVPLNAPNSLLNIFSSWLSREVVFTATYFTFLGLTFLWMWFKKRLSYGVLGLAIIAGLCDVYAMGSIYRYTSMLVWMNDNTYLMFYGAMLTLGAAGYYLLVSFFLKDKGQNRALALLMVVGVSLVVRLIYQPFYENYLLETVYTNESVTFPIDSINAYQQIWSLRLASWVVGFIAIVAIGIGAFYRIKDEAQGVLIGRSQYVLVVGCVCALIAEFMLRYCFYTIHI
ncbi:dimethyl sulfoxide reductase anchor subunit [Providencia sp. JGM181]|uniref:dimethyl sulfoxide reductase anchor subunit family protein n=1 Tax=unclassified Providencia TaxID=2633465 RepID=UPI001BAA859C|nr:MULTISPECIES: DmsC/YnfH family molybdoenzyme membrane anchor subunit [unclassified Providencia]MBS0924831.1 dimethyl sulfoxide reductase anchor subunit [Providencia sp. JGM181]MBS0935007.1 dimethyl sulfoxide reductase anchor subunit [Providencia sp. JGM172]MBS0999222.1 dimethyl sulfoxide reductase anchor subunit [Providencia sp. JGM178]